jgi:hypothetical protein
MQNASGNNHELTLCQITGVLMYNHGTNNKIPASWILLNNQSTIDVFSNGNLLKNVREIKIYAHI